MQRTQKKFVVADSLWNIVRKNLLLLFILQSPSQLFFMSFNHFGEFCLENLTILLLYVLQLPFQLFYIRRRMCNDLVIQLQCIGLQANIIYVVSLIKNYD